MAKFHVMLIVSEPKIEGRKHLTNQERVESSLPISTCTPVLICMLSSVMKSFNMVQGLLSECLQHMTVSNLFGTFHIEWSTKWSCVLTQKPC